MLRTRGLVRVHPHQRKASIATLAVGSFTVAGGHSATVKLRLTPSGRVLLHRDRTMRAAAVVLSRDAAGVKHTFFGLVTLHSPAVRRRS